jgi:hypothetical protein
MGVCVATQKVINKGMQFEISHLELENFTFYNTIGIDKNYKFILFKNKWNRNLSNLFRIRDKEFTFAPLTNKTNVSECNDQSTNITNDQITLCFKITIIVEYLCKDKHRMVEDCLRKGPPNNIRWLFWCNLVKSRKKNNDIDEKIFKNFLQQELDTEIMLQIKKDLHRTAPENKYYQSEEGITSLRNVLKVMALCDQVVSYCQGMNIIVANVLLVSDGNQFETFLVLKYIFDNLEVREFYMKGFAKLHYYIFMIKALIKEKFNNVYNVIENLGVPDEVWLFRWLQTIFMLACDFSICIRIWDCIIADGMDFLIKFCLGLIRYYEANILKAQDMCEFIDAFKLKTKYMTTEEIYIFRETLISHAYNIKVDTIRLNELKVEYENVKNTYDESSIRFKNSKNESFTTIKKESFININSMNREIINNLNSASIDSIISIEDEQIGMRRNVNSSINIRK